MPATKGPIGVKAKGKYAHLPQPDNVLPEDELSPLEVLKIGRDFFRLPKSEERVTGKTAAYMRWFRAPYAFLPTGRAAERYWKFRGRRDEDGIRILTNEMIRVFWQDKFAQAKKRGRAVSPTPSLGDDTEADERIDSMDEAEQKRALSKSNKFAHLPQPVFPLPKDFLSPKEVFGTFNARDDSASVLLKAVGGIQPHMDGEIRRLVRRAKSMKNAASMAKERG